MKVEGRDVVYNPGVQMRPIVATIGRNGRLVSSETTTVANRQPGDRNVQEYQFQFSAAEPGEYALVPIDRYEGFLKSPEDGEKVVGLLFQSTGEGDDATLPASITSQSGTLTLETADAVTGENDPKLKDVKELRFTFSGTFTDAAGNSFELTDGVFHDVAKDRR